MIRQFYQDELHIYTANIFNVLFTLYMCVPLSTVIPLYIVMCMSNACNFYTFSQASFFPLHIFAVYITDIKIGRYVHTSDSF